MGIAQCGSCSVLLDGEEIRTCITPVSYAIGKQVTTMEGLPAVWAVEKKLSAADAEKTRVPYSRHGLTNRSRSRATARAG